MSEGRDEVRGEQFQVQRGDAHVRIQWSEDADVALEDAREALDAIAEVSSGERLPLLVDMSSMRRISRDARQEFSKTRTVSRVALIVRTALSRTVGSFFVGLGRPDNPTRLFTEEEEAMKWLLDDGS